MYEGGWSPLPAISNILFYLPRRDDSLLADPVDRVHAWHLSSEIPLFRRETNEKLPPLSHFPSSPTLRSLTRPPSSSNAPRSRYFYPSLFFASPPVSFTPSCPRVRLNQKFFSSNSEITELSRPLCVSTLGINSAPKIPLHYALLRTARKCIRLVTHYIIFLNYTMDYSLRKNLKKEEIVMWTIIKINSTDKFDSLNSSINFNVNQQIK